MQTQCSAAPGLKGHPRDALESQAPGHHALGERGPPLPSHETRGARVRQPVPQST